MDFSLTEDQLSLKSSIRDFLSAECSSSIVRKCIDDDEVRGELGRQIAALGWPGLVVPEEFGGIGLGWAEAAVLAEEMGRFLFPSPFLGSIVVSDAIVRAGSDEQKRQWLPSLAEGSVIAAPAFFEVRSPELSEIKMKARPSGSGYAIDGTKLFVLGGSNVSLLLLALSVDGKLRLALVDATSPGVSLEKLPVIDVTREQYAVTFQDVQVDASALLPECDLEDVRTRASLFVAGELSGLTRRCLEMCIEYAKDRTQFGKPIGVYQAVSHKIADMYLAAEHSESLVHNAAWHVDNASRIGTDVARLAVWRARAWASSAAGKTTGDAIQIHGGIGFTWEHDLHLFFKRARSNEFLMDESDRLLASISLSAHGG